MDKEMPRVNGTAAGTDEWGNAKRQSTPTLQTDVACNHS